MFWLLFAVESRGCQTEGSQQKGVEEERGSPHGGWEVESEGKAKEIGRGQGLHTIFKVTEP